MNVMVAGGAGFIGSHLVDALLGRGDRVISVDNFLLGKRENFAHLASNPRFKFYERDLRDLSGLMPIFETENIEHVFHLAANSDIRAGGRDPFIDLDNTYLTTFNLLECMRLFGVKRMFFASTSAVYGELRDGLFSEDTCPLYPVSYYGAAKLGSEALISASSSLYGMNSLIFRFPNVLGPRITHGALYDFHAKLQRDPAKLEILGDGKQNKPYMYVDDLIDGILKFMDREEGVTIYNIGVESGTSVTRIADMVCDAMKLKNVRYEFTGGRGGWPGDVPEFRYDLSKIHGAGWRAKYTSDEAVKKTAEEICA